MRTTTKGVGVCLEMGKGEVEHSVLIEVMRGSPIPTPRNKVVS